MTPEPTPSMSPEPHPPHEPRSRSGGRLWLLWLLWLWLVFIGFFSLMSVLILDACADIACEARVMRIWTPLMVVQGLVIVAGAVLAIRDHLTVLIGLAVVSPVLWIIAILLFETVLDR